MEENGGYDSVNRHWGFLPVLVLLLGPACVREASCTLSGAQFKSLYIWSVAVSAMVPWFPGKTTNVSLACILFTDAFEALLGSFDSAFFM